MFITLVVLIIEKLKYSITIISDQIVIDFSEIQISIYLNTIEIENVN